MNFQTGKKFLINFIILTLLSLGVLLTIANTLLNNHLSEELSLKVNQLSKISLILYQSSINEFETHCLELKNNINDEEYPLKETLNHFREKYYLDKVEIINNTNYYNPGFKEINVLLDKAKTSNIISITELINNKISQIIILPLNKDNYLFATRKIDNDSPIIKSISNELDCIVSIETLNNLKEDPHNKDVFKALRNFSSYNGTIYLNNKRLTGSASVIKNNQNKDIAVLLVGIDPKNYTNIKNEGIVIILIAFILSIGLIGSVGFISHKQMTKCLENLNTAIKAARDGDLTQKIEMTENSACSILAKSLNEMFIAMHGREYEIKSFQEELRSKKENLEAIFNSSTDGIMTLSSDLKIMSVNPTITQWAGVPSRKIVGHHFNEFVKCICRIKMSDIDCNDPDACPIASHWAEEMPKEGQITNISTGQITFIGLNCSPIHGLTKTKESFVAVLMDITQLKTLEKVKENFVATLTHDLRVPLLAENHALKYLIKGSYGQLTENQKVATETMLKSNEDLVKLVNTLLDVYKYESGASKLFKENVNLHELVNECISELSPLAKKNSQQINNNISDNISAINADKNEIKRVLINLISNAIRYTQENGIIKLEGEQNSTHIIIKVIDNGKGIPEHDLKNIFDRYYTSAKKFRKVGTGLGLYLSKQIINAHNGKIWVESKYGQGSTFYFSIPLKIEENE